MVSVPFRSVIVAVPSPPATDTLAWSVPLKVTVTVSGPSINASSSTTRVIVALTWPFSIVTDPALVSV